AGASGGIKGPSQGSGAGREPDRSITFGGSTASTRKTRIIALRKGALVYNVENGLDTGAGRLVAPDDKFDRLQHLIQRGKEKAYALYDELSEVLPTDLNNTPEIDDLLTLDGTNKKILEEPRLEFEKKR